MSGLIPKILKDFHRHDILNFLQGHNNIGIELGVAEGIFSERMAKSGKFARIIGIDMYSDSHDTKQYKRALSRLGVLSDYKILRMRFDEAIDLFDDESIDFIYIDGYAHGGEEGGETIFEWYGKVRVGGIIAGDDYHSDWPLVCLAVDEFARQVNSELLVTGKLEYGNQYCKYPTWAVVKKSATVIHAPRDLVAMGKNENRRIARLQHGGLVKRLIPWLVPAPIIDKIKAWIA